MSSRFPTPGILALDLQHAIAVADAKAAREEWEFLKCHDVDLDHLAEVLASIRGAMLGVTVTDESNGAIRIDFDQDAAVLKDLAKPLYGAAGGYAYAWTAQEDVRGEMATRARVSTQERIRGNVQTNLIRQGIAESSAAIRRRSRPCEKMPKNS